MAPRQLNKSRVATHDGAVLVPGGVTPKLVTRAMVVGMRPGSVIVDISIDQGGCCETSRQTTLTEHTYIEVGVTHSRRKFKSIAAQLLHNCAIAHRGGLPVQGCINLKP